MDRLNNYSSHIPCYQCTPTHQHQQSMSNQQQSITAIDCEGKHEAYNNTLDLQDNSALIGGQAHVTCLDITFAETRHTDC